MPIAQETRHLRGSVFGGRRARRVPTWRRGVDDSDGDPDERISFAPPQEQCPSPTDTSIGSSSEVSGNVTVREAHWVRAKEYEPADRPAPRHLWPQHNSTQMESMRSTKARRSMPSTDENKTNRIPEGDALIGVGLSCAKNAFTGWHYVQKILPGSAAAASRIACFDELVTLDGRSLNPESGQPLSEEELREHMRGALGTTLTISLRKPTGQGSHVYVVNLVRSCLETRETFDVLFPECYRRRTRPGPVALRLVLDGEVTYAVAKMRKLVCTLMKGVQEQVLRRWRDHLLISKQVHAKVEKTTQRLVNASQISLRALRAWLEPVSRKADLGRKLGRWWQCNQQKMTSAAFSRWSSHVLLERIERANMNKIHALRQFRCISAAFLMFKLQSVQEPAGTPAELKRSMAMLRKFFARRWKRLDTARPFSTWRERWREDAKRRRIMRRLTCRVAFRVLSQTFLRLSNLIAEERRLRVLHSKCVLRWCNRAMWRVVSHWSDRVLRRKRLVAVCGMVIQRWRRFDRMRAFGKWSAELQEAREGRSRAEQFRANDMMNMCLTQMRSSALSMAVRCWSEVAHRMKNLHNKTAKVVIRWGYRKLSVAFHAYWHRVDERKKFRFACKRAVKHFLLSSLSLAWNTWRDAWRRLKSRGLFMHNMLNRTRRGVLAKILDSWFDLVLYHRSANKTVVNALVMWKNHALSKGWMAWTYLHGRWNARKVCMRKILLCWMRWRLAGMWRGWGERCAVVKRRREIITAVVLRWQHIVLQKAMARWSLKLMQRNGVLLAAAKLRSLCSLQIILTTRRLVLVSWRMQVAYSGKKRIALDVVRRIISRYQRGDLSCACYTWRANACRMQTLVQHADVMFMRVQDTLVSACLQSWHSLTEAESRDETKSARNLAYRKGITGALSKLVQMTQIVVYKCWRQYATNRRRRSSRMQHMAALKRARILLGFMQTVLIRWRCYMRQGYQLKILEKMVGRLDKSTRLEKSMHHWKQNSARWKHQTWAARAMALTRQTRILALLYVAPLLARWQGLHGRRKRLSGSAAKVCKLRNEWLIASTFIALKTVVKELAALQVAGCKVIQLFQCLCLNKAFSHWNDLAIKIQCRTSLRQKCVWELCVLAGRAETRFKTNSFRRWSLCALDRKQMRMKAVRLAGRETVRWFRRWEKFRILEERRQIGMFRLVARGSRGVQLAALQQWLHNVQETAAGREERLVEQRTEEMVRRQTARRERNVVAEFLSAWRVDTVQEIAARSC